MNPVVEAECALGYKSFFRQGFPENCLIFTFPISHSIVEFQGQELKEIVDLIHQKFDLDLGNYAKYSLQRRFEHVSILNGLQSKNDLIRFIEHQYSKDSLLEKITVGTTEMFRDPGLWRLLRSNILPKLKKKGNLSICHMGCSSGEEVYSLLILLTELDMLQSCKVLALDLNPGLLASAERGSYPISKLSQFQANYANSGASSSLMAFIQQADQTQFCIKQPKDFAIRFGQFDLVKDDCDEKFDLLFCRNVLIYFNSRLQGQSLTKLMDYLKPGGYLVFGHNESILNQSLSPRLKPFLPAENIFQSRD